MAGQELRVPFQGPQSTVLVPDTQTRGGGGGSQEHALAERKAQRRLGTESRLSHKATCSAQGLGSARDPPSPPPLPPQAWHLQVNPLPPPRLTGPLPSAPAGCSSKTSSSRLGDGGCGDPRLRSLQTQNPEGEPCPVSLPSPLDSFSISPQGHFPRRATLTADQGQNHEVSLFFMLFFC